MAIEIKLSKSDSGTSFGFRLVGGAEFNQPVVVVKVNPESIAEDAGLMTGDVIARVNDTATAGLTHVDVHDIIHKAGNEVIFGVRRGFFSDITAVNDEENNIEIQDILCNLNTTDSSEVQKDYNTGSPPRALENLAGQERIMVSSESIVVDERKNKPKKWSTFLVKPRNPKPLPQKIAEERKIIGEPYRVKIIKQPRRDPNDVLNHKKTVHFEQAVSEVEYSEEDTVADMIESIESLHEQSKAELEMDVSVTVEEETTIEITEMDDTSDKNSDTIENDSLECEGNVENESVTIKKPKPILKPAPLDIHIDPTICESSLSLEEQLAAVQKQLMALSNLPSAIQVTLEAVTQQLNKIVCEKSSRIESSYAEENDYVESNSDNYNEGENEEQNDEECQEEMMSVSENAEEDITENEGDENHNIEELEEDDNVAEEKEDSVQEDVEDLNRINSDPYAGLTEEEKEARTKAEELAAKKQKEEEERRKMDWTQRPIILPGGRKWSDPDDAVPKYQAPKMSDEKISKTIEDYSEVIVGKTKGINFLKYQPPPKNMDYLQKSEVYRLIHGMEPPTRGVGARAEKVLSEKDYYGVK